MMRCTLPLVLLLTAAVCACPAAGKPQAASAKGGFAAKAEALYAAIPHEKIDRAAGFFAPVVKRKMPVLKNFQRDYARAADKAAVIVRYLPEAEDALAQAKAMKVSPKYEAEKKEYLRYAEAFVLSLRMMAYFKGPTP